jgi:hypothetical protein
VQILILVCLLVVLVLFIFLFKFIKHPIAVVISILIGLFSILVAAAGFLVYRDVMSIKDKALGLPSLCVLQGKNNQIIAGIVIQPEIKPIEKGLIFLNRMQISNIQDAFGSERVSSLISSSKEFRNISGKDLFKVVNVKEDFLKNLPVRTIQIQSFRIDKDELILFLESKDIYLDMARELSDNKELLSLLPSEFSVSKKDETSLAAAIEETTKSFASGEDELKGVMFAMSVTPLFQGNSPENIEYVLSEFQKGDIVVYPESIAISILKVMPKSAVEQVLAMVVSPAGNQTPTRNPK